MYNWKPSKSEWKCWDHGSPILALQPENQANISRVSLAEETGDKNSVRKFFIIVDPGFMRDEHKLQQTLGNEHYQPAMGYFRMRGFFAFAVNSSQDIEAVLAKISEVTVVPDDVRSAFTSSYLNALSFKGMIKDFEECFEPAKDTMSLTS